MKSWVNDPEVLGGLATVVPEIVSESVGNEGAALVKIADTPVGIDAAQLSAAVEEVLTPEYLSEKTDPIIDGIYDWLEGNTDKPEFEVNFTDRLTAVVNAMKAPLTSELAKLPDCPASIEYTTNFNPLESPCVPLGIDIEGIVNTFSEYATSNATDIDITVSSDDLDLSDEVLENAPRVYSGLAAMPAFFGILTLLFGVAAVFLADTKTKGLRWLSWSMVINAAITTVGFWLVTRSDTFSSEATDATEKLIFDEVVTPLVKTVLKDIGNTGVTLGLAVFVMGIAIWLLTHVYHKVHEEQSADNKKIKNAIPTDRQQSIYINRIAGETKKEKPKKSKKK